MIIRVPDEGRCENIVVENSKYLSKCTLSLSTSSQNEGGRRFNISPSVHPLVLYFFVICLLIPPWPFSINLAMLLYYAILSLSYYVHNRCNSNAIRYIERHYKGLNASGDSVDR